MKPITEFAYGGIVFNREGKVLMRSPSGHWGGYVWTFAKGGADPADRSPEETALREVLEETGHECVVIAPIPGEFQSDTCMTKYFLMKPTTRIIQHDHETQEIRWVAPDQALDMIQLTRTEKGRTRDRNALQRAIETKALYEHILKTDSNAKADKLTQYHFEEEARCLLL